MALPIEWSKEAKSTFQNILAYLEEKWTDKEIKNFINRADAVLKIIKERPLVYQASKSKSIRRAVVTKHNKLFYRVTKSKIHLIYFWDTRQNPKKNKY